MQYLTTDTVLNTDDTAMDVTAMEGPKTNSMPRARAPREQDQTPASIEDKILQMERQRDRPDFGREYGEDKFVSDNVNITGPPITAG